MNRSKWLALRATPRHVGTRRYLHVSTRYGLRVKSLKPYLVEFAPAVQPGDKLPRRWSERTRPGPNTAPGTTYERSAPKPHRPGRTRRTRLARERAQQSLWERMQALAIRKQLSIFQ
jgi:hypothetical protein